MEYGGQTIGEGAQEARGGSWGVEEGFWNPGGRRRGGRGELQGPCNHCFAEGMFAEEQCILVVRLFNPNTTQNMMYLHYIDTATCGATHLLSLQETQDTSLA